MKRFAIAALSCALAFPLAAQNVATVNGEAITQKQVDEFITLLVEQGAKDSPELREQVKKEMTVRLVATQEAKKMGLDKKPEVAQELELAQQGILVRALLNDYVTKHPLSDKDIQAEYDRLKKEEAGQKEYKVKHILVKEEAEAKQLLADIKAKKISFADAAKEKSIDPGSGAQGGDLGWAPNTVYVEEFSDAVAKQKKGELSAAPVQSQFGWHILQVDDVRDITFPALDEVKPQIEELLRQKQLTDFQNSLMEKAKIQ
ncbi:peptidylprolyl isomerase [Paenalcaligenes hominis]|uniref:peptidylprolyl isomerase n=1 Tax=Paenalcaligenes hominis TaxID=643674 RepID=A0A1U9JZC5_9BURK|nr:peptidylprolyl isomerase [Paenalcaligenes hominis]AQS51128.1 peptidylprolyl isomerase [Paenalcaligenes hominis]